MGGVQRSILGVFPGPLFPLFSVPARAPLSTALGSLGHFPPAWNRAGCACRTLPFSSRDPEGQRCPWKGPDCGSDRGVGGKAAGGAILALLPSSPGAPGLPEAEEGSRFAEEDQGSPAGSAAPGVLGERVLLSLRYPQVPPLLLPSSESRNQGMS